MNFDETEGKDTPGEFDSGKKPSSDSGSRDVEESGDLEDHVSRGREIGARERTSQSKSLRLPPSLFFPFLSPTKDKELNSPDVVEESEPSVLVLLNVQSLLQSRNAAKPNDEDASGSFRLLSPPQQYQVVLTKRC